MRRLSFLRHEYDPLILAEQSSSINQQYNPDGTRQADAGLLAGVGTALGLSNPFTAALSLAPTVFNLGMGLFGKQETLNPQKFQNPYEGRAMSLMSSRKFNANPLLEANQSAAASANYNIRNAGLGAGAYASNRIGIQNARMRADSQALATQQQANAQYRGEEASMLGNFGSQRAQTNLMISDLNARNKAAHTNYLSAGFSQLGQFNQNQQLMANQKKSDNMVMEQWKEYIELLRGGGGSSLRQPGAGTQPSPLYSREGDWVI